MEAQQRETRPVDFGVFLLAFIYIADMLTLRLIDKMILYVGDTALHYVFDKTEELENAMQKDALALHK